MGEIPGAPALRKCIVTDPEVDRIYAHYIKGKNDVQFIIYNS